MSYFAALSLLASVSLLLVATFTLSRRGESTSNRLFCGLLYALSVMAFAEFGMRQADTIAEATAWLRVYALWPVAIALLLHLALTYTSRLRPARATAVLAAIYVPAILLCVAELLTGAIFGSPVLRPWGWSRDLAHLSLPGWFFRVWAVTAGVGSVVLFARRFAGSAGLATRREASIIALAAGLMIAAGVLVDMLGGLLGLQLPEVLLTCGTASAAIVAWGLSRHELTTIVSRQLTYDIVTLMPDCLLLADTDHRIMLANPAATRLLGYSAPELTGRTVASLFVQGVYDTDLFRNTRMQQVSRGAFADIDAHLLSKSGEQIPVSVSEALLRTKAGRPVGIVFIARDLRERKRMEDELRRTQKLDSLCKAAGGVAHDFNNILNIISGSLSMGRLLAQDSPELLNLFDEADQASTRAADLCRRLVTFTRDDAVQRSITLLPPLVRDTADLFLRNSRTTWQLQAAADVWPLEMDGRQVSQVVMNLVLNASQAMDGGGSVSIACANQRLAEGQLAALPAGPYVCLTVSDSGCGIAPADLPKVFDHFFTTKKNGHGLGLSTSRAIVRDHGGHISVESQPGAGTTFRVYLPARPEEALRAAELSAAATGAPGPA